MFVRGNGHIIITKLLQHVETFNRQQCFFSFKKLNTKTSDGQKTVIYRMRIIKQDELSRHKQILKVIYKKCHLPGDTPELSQAERKLSHFL